MLIPGYSCDAAALLLLPLLQVTGLGNPQLLKVASTSLKEIEQLFEQSDVDREQAPAASRS